MHPVPPPERSPDGLPEVVSEWPQCPADANDERYRFRTLINLVPVVGIVPSLWTLYQANPAEPTLRSASRTAVVLALSWISATVLLSAGANLPLSHWATMRLLLANGFVGTGYFLANFWLMWRVWQRKSTRLPIVSAASRRLP